MKLNELRNRARNQTETSWTVLRTKPLQHKSCCDTASAQNNIATPHRERRQALPVLLMWLGLFSTCLGLFFGQFSDAGGDEAFFQKAVPGRVLTFPQDHGKHPDFQTEWWYFTGNLQSSGERAWGFQLTFFRRSFTKEAARKKSSWAVRDIYPGHFALTDVKNHQFFHTEIISREGPGLAGASNNHLNVFVKNWSAEQQGESIHIKATDRKHALELTLTPEKPLVLHGELGFSRKGGSKEQASYYYSFTRLKAQGKITFAGRSHSVSGLVWMDHEFGSSILEKHQVGWDWLSLQLNDGTELMAFYLRRKDGIIEKPFGTFVPKQGKPANLHGSKIRISSIGSWTSPHTSARYPSGWLVEIPDAKLKLKVTPLIEDQELHSTKTVGIAYWEGAVAVSGSRAGKNVKGKGYVELTGYAGAIGKDL